MKTIQYFRAAAIEELEKKYNAAASRWFQAGGKLTAINIKLSATDDPEEIYYLKQQGEVIDKERVEASNETAAIHDILKALEAIAG